MIVTAHPPGTLCWVDLGTARPERAARFYAALLGWAVDAPDAAGYRLCRIDGRLVGGLVADDQAEPWWTTNVSVADIDAAAAAVSAAGGTVYAGPATLGTRGRFASATDPAGTKVLQWQPLADHGVELHGAVGTWVGTTLFTADWARVAPFYAGVFGWRGEPTADGEVALTTAGGRPVGVVAPLPDGWPPARRARWVPSFGVHDVADAVARVVALGGTAVSRSADGARALVQDDQGALLGLGLAG